MNTQICTTSIVRNNLILSLLSSVRIALEAQNRLLQPPSMLEESYESNCRWLQACCKFYNSVHSFLFISLLISLNLPQKGISGCSYGSRITSDRRPADGQGPMCTIVRSTPSILMHRIPIRSPQLFSTGDPFALVLSTTTM